MSFTAILSVESSAISQVSFDYDGMQVGVTYNSNPDKSYVFSCTDPVSVEDQIRTTESVGKLISQLKKEGTLQTV